MATMLGEALRRLCADIGWSYAVFWNAIRCGNSRHLVWAEGHHEPCRASSSETHLSEFDRFLLKEYGAFPAVADDANPLVEIESQADDKVSSLISKMRSQVHVVGEGMIGRAAITGKHQWIVRSDESCVAEGLDEMDHQFSAGIKTIAIVPVIPHGIVQLGSVQMVMENKAHIQHVNKVFLQLGCMPGACLSDCVLKDIYLKNKAPLIDLPNSMRHSVTDFSNLSSLLSFNSENLVSQVNKSLMINPLNVSGGPSFDKADLGSRPATTVADMPTYHCSDVPTIPTISSSEGIQCQQTPRHGSSYSSQSQSCIVGSTLTSNTLSFIEEQLFSNVGDHWLLSSVSASETTKSVKLHCRGKQISSSLKDPFLPVCKVESPANENHFGLSGIIRGSTEKMFGIGNEKSFVNAASQLVSSMNHPGGNSASAVSSQSSAERQIESMPIASMSTIGNNLFQPFQNPGMDIKPSSLPSGTFTSNARDCWVTSSNLVQSSKGGNYACGGNNDLASNSMQKAMESRSVHIGGQGSSDVCIPWISDDDLFDVLGMDFKSRHCSRNFDTYAVGINDLSTGESGTDNSTCISKLEVDPTLDIMDGRVSGCGIFAETGPDQLLDAVVSKINLGAKQRQDTDLYGRTATTRSNSSAIHTSSSECGWATLQQQMHGQHCSHPFPVLKAEHSSSSIISAGSVGVTGEYSKKDAPYKSQISLWVDNGQNMKNDRMLSAHCREIDEMGKSNRKRPRPGESPRPRPKDRQMIQDRVKELREIVPNGAKCSIDALLERTIKHMLFLQSVTKHADKLRETGEPKIISKGGGLLLKDNFEGGATWAFEVGTRSMVCPIIVEDLKPPRQLLVEMLCEERGFFLEIADLIRGLGLTILKGVMEARSDKVWARFAVEANRDVTRMDIFMSLVRLLEPNAAGSIAAQSFDNSKSIPCNVVCQSSVPAICLANELQ